MPSRPSVPALTVLLVAATLTAGSPAHADTAAPATPVRVTLVAGATSMRVTWQQPATGPRARWFEVAEGDTVAARSTTTSALIPVAFGSRHTYTVTAVDGDGDRSAAAGPVSGYAWTSGLNPECLPPSPLTVTATDVTATAASLSWPRHPLGSDLELRVGGTTWGHTTLTSARIGGLAPATTYGVGLYRYNACLRMTVPVATGSFTTAPGGGGHPGAPTAPTITGRSDETIGLTWTAPEGTRPARYVVYDGDTPVARTSSTSVTVRRLYHATAHTFTVAALDAAGGESAHTVPLRADTEACLTGPPRPVALAATAVSPSSVRLSWTFFAAALSYTVLDGDRVVAVAAGPDTMVTGLASGSRHRYRVATTLPDGCGESPRSTAVVVSTPPGPSGRPAAPAGLQLTGNAPLDTSTTALVLSWTGSGAAGYRVYEGASLAGETTGPQLSLTVGAGTRHTYTVVAVDGTAIESAPAPALTVQAMYLSPP